jgi:hypothetical protein
MHFIKNYDGTEYLNVSKIIRIYIEGKPFEHTENRYSLYADYEGGNTPMTIAVNLTEEEAQGQMNFMVSAL